MKKECNFLYLILIIILFLQIISASTGTLNVTYEHPFLINGKWIPASQLKVGDFLTTLDGKKAKITSIKDIVPDNPFLVYNLEAGLFHNFVVTKDDLIVHNSNDPACVGSFCLGPNCFASDTLVTLGNRSHKKIQDINVGDKVLSWDFINKNYSVSNVDKLIISNHSDIFIINGHIKVTSEHPFYTKEIGYASINPSNTQVLDGFTLGKLEVGQHLIDENGNLIRVDDIESTPGNIITYNLEIPIYHNYYAEGVLVHNKCPVSIFQKSFEVDIERVKAENFATTVERLVKEIRTRNGDDKTLIAILDMMGSDKAYYNYPDFFNSKNIQSAFSDRSEVIINKIQDIFDTMKAELKKAGVVLDAEKSSKYLEIMRKVFREKQVSDNDFFDVVTILLSKNKVAGSFYDYTSGNMNIIIDGYSKMMSYFKSNSEDGYYRIYFLRDGETMWARDVALNGPDKSSLALTSRQSILTPDEAILYSQKRITSDQGIIYKKLLMLFPMARRFVQSRGLSGRAAYESFQTEFTRLLKLQLDKDPVFAQAANIAFDSLHLDPTKNYAFIDTGVKGTIPTFISGMQRIKNPCSKTTVYLLGVSGDYMNVIPGAFNEATVYKIELVRKLSESIDYSDRNNPQILQASPLDELFSRSNIPIVTTPQSVNR